MATNTEIRTEKGASLARGPALILGTILQVAGLYFLYKQHGFLPFSNFPNGNAPVPGKVFLGIFGANGWTGLFTAAAGDLLLFGAAQHLLAKTTSLIVGVALGAAAVIALVSGNVLGLAAANSWTKIGWAACAVILLFNTVVPRRTRTVTEPVVAQRGTPVEPSVEREPARYDRERAVSDREPVTRTDEPAVASDHATVASDHEPAVASDHETVASHHETVASDHEAAVASDHETVASKRQPVTEHREATAADPATQPADDAHAPRQPSQS